MKAADFSETSVSVSRAPQFVIHPLATLSIEAISWYVSVTTWGIRGMDTVMKIEMVT
jgi:hypothetical protein